MEIKIGVQYSSRELVLETDESSEAVEQALVDALGSAGVFAVTDTKGRRVVVPADKVAYVELGGGVAGHVGFRG
jgi:hypothetical protein